MDAGFPVNALAAARGLLVVGGGGGPGNSGVPNTLRLVPWAGDAALPEPATETAFGRDEDAPWSLALHPEGTHVVAGVNAPGKNHNCRVFALDTKRRLTPKTAFSTVVPRDGDPDYQCACAFSPATGKYLATGSDAGNLCCFATAGFTQLAWSPLQLPSKIYDVGFTHDAARLVAATERAVRVYDVESGELVLELQPPKGHAFRAAKIDPVSHLLYTLVNQARAKAYVSVFDLSSSRAAPRRTVCVGRPAAVSLAVHGDVTAVGLADASLVLLRHLCAVRRIPNAHDVPITALVASPTHVVSGSADWRLKTWSVPERTHPLAIVVVLLLVLAVMVWAAANAMLDAAHLRALGVPYLVARGGGRVGIEVAHIAWLKGLGLDRVLG